ncbi:MAG: response regulator [Pedobacter sp.]|nr:MAG: response regulator [Pedobacter sp.]
MNQTNINILIADDDEAIVDATSIMLEALGHTVSQITDGTLILENLKKKRPDLLLLDIWMSGVDGREICQQIKQDPELLSIPVLMISASRQIKESALSCGADDFLAKPFEMMELVNKIESLTSLKLHKKPENRNNNLLTPKCVS